MSDKAIYLVWNPGGENPKVRHDSVEKARAEARRLAEANKGVEFFVLRAVESFEYRDDPWRCRHFCKESLSRDTPEKVIMQSQQQHQQPSVNQCVHDFGFIPATIMKNCRKCGTSGFPTI